MTFKEIGIIDPILKALDAQGYTHPTPIQEQSIPILLKGKDLLGCAQTGTGKTAAFGIPIIQHLYNNKTDEKGRRKIKSLVVTPTRELAIQISENFTAYGKFANVRNTVVFGGVKQGSQVNALKAGVDVLVATPGRLLDLCTSTKPTKNQKGKGKPALSLSKVEYFVLDEADRMLDLGFQIQLNAISKLIGDERQTLFFSATWPTHVQRAASQLLKTNAVQLRIGTEGDSTGTNLIVQETIEQTVMVIRQEDKRTELRKLLLTLKENEGKTIIFFKTKICCDETAHLYGNLPNVPKSNALHGNLDQRTRLEVMHDFRTSNIRLLFATDVAARGLDILDIDLVINYDFPVQRGK